MNSSVHTITNLSIDLSFEFQQNRLSESVTSQKRRVVDETGKKYTAVVPDSEIIPKDDNDEDFQLVDEDDEENDEENDDEVEKLNSENDFEDFEDFEEVSIDGSCSTSTPTTAKAPATPQQKSPCEASAEKRTLPKFQFAKVDEMKTADTEVASPGVIFMCKPCQIYFPVRRMLETHMSTIHDESEKVKEDKWAERNARAGYIKLDDGTFSCRYCDYKAPGRTTVSTHVGRKHGRRRPYGADYVPKPPKEKPRKKSAKAEPKEMDDPLIYITKVVMTVDNLSSQPEPEPDEPQDASNAVSGDEVPEALNEEEVVDGQVSHVRRMCEYSCPYCRYETRKRADMHAHITEKHNEAWYESVAQQEAEREQRKQKDTYNPLDGRHYCHYCQFSASSRPTLNAHTRRKHKGFVQPYRSRKLAPVEFHCDQCDFKTMYRHKIQAHIERRHVAEPRYTCEYCGRKYKTKSDLTSHMRFQHFHQPLVCELCGKVCTNSNALHIHKKREHFKPDFECPICKRRMVSQANLDEHTQRQHTEKQHYMCEQCGKVFDQPCKLKQHTMTHTGERPNICHICGKAFARRAVFRQHLLIHSGERPYVCDICGKAFTQKPGLICHRKSHPGDKPPLPVVYIDSILDKFLSKS